MHVRHNDKGHSYKGEGRRAVWCPSAAAATNLQWSTNVRARDFTLSTAF